MTFEKKYKIIFLWEKMAPKLVVFQSWKKLQVLEKNVFRKENLSNLFVQIRSSKHCAEIFFEINGSRDI